MSPRRRITFLLPAAATLLAAAALLPGAAGQEHTACDAAKSLPEDPACSAGLPAADAPRAVSWSALPAAFHPAPDRPNPSNTTLSAPARPVAGEPFTVVLATTLPETKPAVHGNGTLYEIAFPDMYEDEADTSVAILFGGELEVLSSDPALGAPSLVGDGAHAIAGTVPATPGVEHRFEFTLLPSREGTAEIHAAGFLLADARLILDVMPGTAQGSNSAREPGAGPDPGAPAGRGIPHDASPANGAIPWEASGVGHASRGVADPAAPAANGTERSGGGVRGHSSAAASQDDEVFTMYGQIRYNIPYSDERGAAHDVRVCAIANSRWVDYADGTSACTFTNQYGHYVLGPLNRTELRGDATELRLSLAVFSYGSGARVVDAGAHVYWQDIRSHLAASSEKVRIDMEASEYNRHRDRAVHIASTIADTRAYFGELGIEIPPVRVFWEPGKRAADLWPSAAGGGGPPYDPDDPAIFLDGLDSTTTHDASKSRYAIQHAYAHHTYRHVVGAPDGCAHDLAANTSPGCAFAEGFARFVPHMVDDTPYLREHGNTFIDIERELRVRGGNAEPLFGYGGSADGQTAMQVAAALWDVYDAPADGTHDRRRSAEGGTIVPEGPVLDDVHAGAGGIISTMLEGPRSAKQFHAMWTEAGRESIDSVMELHRLPLGGPDDLPDDLLEFSPIAAVRVDHAKGAAVPLSAAVPGGGAASLGVVRGFAVDGRGHGGAAVSDNGDGTGTLLLRPAMADVGRHEVVVRASHAGQADLARIDVTVTDPVSPRCRFLAQARAARGKHSR